MSDPTNDISEGSVPEENVAPDAGGEESTGEEGAVLILGLAQDESGESFTHVDIEARPDVASWGEDIIDIIEDIASEYVPEGLEEAEENEAFVGNLISLLNSMRVACESRGYVAPEDETPGQRWPKNKKAW